MHMIGGTVVPLSDLETTVTTVLRVTFELLLRTVIVVCKYANSWNWGKTTHAPCAATWVEENNNCLVLLTCIKSSHINLVRCLKIPLRYQEIARICREIHKIFWWEEGYLPFSHSPPCCTCSPCGPREPTGALLQLFWIFFHNALASLSMDAACDVH